MNRCHPRNRNLGVNLPLNLSTLTPPPDTSAAVPSFPAEPSSETPSPTSAPSGDLPVSLALG